MKNRITKILCLALAIVMCVGLMPACTSNEDNTIYVGNTAGTTGALANIGVPFNLGINAAFAEYNQNGGFNGRNVALKHYDDKGDPTKSKSLMETLVYEDEVFAIVGNYGGYAVNVNLDILKANNVPMVYAAAGVDALYNNNATSLGDRCIFPVQPLNKTEGKFLILRAFANPTKGEGADMVLTGGMGAKKVGVIANQDEASQGILRGIKEEAEMLPESKKNNIIYQEIAGNDFMTAATEIVSKNCDTVIVTVTGDAAFIAALTALSQANYRGNVLTSYNNADAGILNKNGVMTAAGQEIVSKMTIYAQGWLDITSDSYVYKEETGLFRAYKMQNSTQYGNGVAGFTESYWKVAEAIYNYANSNASTKGSAWAMSYNSYALAGYIAGNMFCAALEELEKSGKELTRENLVEIMEIVELPVAMVGNISYTNGQRTGLEKLSAAVFVNSADPSFGENATKDPQAVSIPVVGLQSIDELRALITE